MKATREFFSALGAAVRAAALAGRKEWRARRWRNNYNKWIDKQPLPF